VATYKYLKFFQVAFKQSMSYRGATYGRFVFYGVILFIFSRLWLVVGNKITGELSATDMVWYLSFTELIVLSTPLLHMDIEEDIRSGNIAYLFIRPTNYIFKLFSEGMGQFCARMLVLLLAGFLFPLLFTGKLPSHPLALAVFPPLALMAGGLYILIQICVGLSAFWLQDSSPVQWVTQKFLFILGGMILPLSMYPMWAQKLANLTPFPAMLALPATGALLLDGSLLLNVVGKLILWFVLLSLLALGIFRQCEKNLSINGG